MTDQRPDRRAESFERLFSEYVAHHQSPATGFVMPRLANLILRRRGIALLSSRGAILTGAVSASVALGIPLVLTGLAGHWAGAPVARWVLIALAMGLLDAWTVAGWAQPTRSLNAVLHTIERESDLRRVLIFCRRWYRPRVSTMAAASLTLLIVLLAGLVAPVPLSRLPIGSIALLVIMLYYSGELTFASVIPWPVMSLQARFEHRLYWPSPADSMAVQDQLRALAGVDFGRGLGVTAYLVLAGVLLSLTSPLLLPIAVALIATGYVSTLVSIVTSRSAVRKIIRSGAENNLALLQGRIASFGAAPSELTPMALERVRKLIELHDMIRDSPTSPKRRQALSHAVGSLIIPTITFFAAVLAQEYAARVLDNLLP